MIGLEDGVALSRVRPLGGGPTQTVVKGPRQRTHDVQIADNGDILVRLTKMPGGKEELPSDHYCPATDEEKRRMGLLK